LCSENTQAARQCAFALQEIGLDADEEQLSDILKRIKELGDKGKRVTDADLQAIADAVLEIKSRGAQ